MKTMQPAPMIGRVARITNAMVQRRLMAMAAPQTNIAKRLNILPIFSPVAFW